ncbi:hypothetical protein ANO11243_078150 [Dothideomycetidae sp. 11243]|nr:hypothetical protein ANO11243_078150 [fungal sp. No.11243]
MAAAELLMQSTPAARPRPAYTSLTRAPATPGSPHTPVLSRNLSSHYGSPGSQRVEDENVIYEIGARVFRVGFAGDVGPKYICEYGPQSNIRAGDYVTHISNVRTRPDQTLDTIAEWELWDYRLSELDLGLVQDKLDRALRTAHEKHLLLDIKSRNAVIVLPPGLPNPLIEIVLKAIFTSNTHPKSVFLMSSPVLCAISAGLRSALVVDIGWHETNVTAVYEYREVSQDRSTRAGKRIALETGKMLSASVQTGQPADALRQNTDIPFATISRVMTSLLWCRNGETESNASGVERNFDISQAGAHISVNFTALSKPAECLLQGPHLVNTDQHDVPIPQLIRKSLMALPKDVRGICMSRIIFTGGCSDIPGIKTRVMEELRQMLEDRGWNPYLTRPNAQSVSLASVQRPAHPSQGMSNSISKLTEGQQPELIRAIASESSLIGQVRDSESSLIDDITRRLERESIKSRPPPAVKGKVRAVQSLGAWVGASLMSHLRMEGSVEIKRDDFLRHAVGAAHQDGNAHADQSPTVQARTTSTDDRGRRNKIQRGTAAVYCG